MCYSIKSGPNSDSEKMVCVFSEFTTKCFFLTLGIKLSLTIFCFNGNLIIGLLIAVCFSCESK